MSRGYVGKPTIARGSYECSREVLISAKREATKAARDLGYGNETIEKIRNANSVIEVSTIMKTRRKEMMEDD